MKTRVLIPVFVSLILSCSIMAQTPSVDIPITVSNLAGDSKQLKIGLDPAATDSIDKSLGELVYPPFPPSDVFDAAFELPCSTAEYSLKDYRKGEKGSAVQKEYRLIYQPGAGTKINISWDLPTGITGTLQDVILGTVINQPMSGSGSFTVEDPLNFTKLKMTISFPSSPIKVNARLLLQGAYSSGSMTTKLLNNNLIPLDQPYNKAPWSYAGTEALQSVPSGVVDWIIVELRTSTASSSKVARRAALLKCDGTVSDLDGSSLLSFQGVQSGNYYIVIYHRNHLSVMSSAAIALNSNSDIYDFTTGLDKYYGNDAMDLGGGKFGMYAGDANSDGQVTSLDFNDFNPKFNSAAAGYETADWNMDGQVTSLDFNLFNPNFNSAKSTKVQ